MPIQFPNFLGVPVRTPDYSGLGDIVENYYKGKAMPKDDLIKAIQTQFAQPTAQESLTGLQLGNTKTQLDIEKMQREAAQQKAFEQQLKDALTKGGVTGATDPNAGVMPSPTTSGYPPSSPPAMNPSLVQALTQPQQVQLGQGAQLPADVTNNMPSAGGLPSMPTQPPVAPAVAPSKPEEAHEIVIKAGAPHLAGVDAMWDNSPLSRAYLEKQGYKKKEVIKFNNKTGATTIETTYPSGTITTKTVVPEGGAGTGEAPLTTKMVSKHQNIISSIDTAKPIIQKIIDEKGFQPYPLSYEGFGTLPGMGNVPGFMGQSTKYNAMVKSALDSLIGAYGLPMTNEGINTVKDQLQITHGETTGAYRTRLRELIKDLDRRKAYSAAEVKKTLKNPPIDSGGNSYSSDEWEPANDQQ